MSLVSDYSPCVRWLLKTRSSTIRKPALNTYHSGACEPLAEHQSAASPFGCSRPRARLTPSPSSSVPGATGSSLSPLPEATATGDSWLCLELTRSSWWTRDQRGRRRQSTSAAPAAAEPLRPLGLDRDSDWSRGREGEGAELGPHGLQESRRAAATAEDVEHVRHVQSSRAELSSPPEPQSRADGGRPWRRRTHRTPGAAAAGAAEATETVVGKQFNVGAGVTEGGAVEGQEGGPEPADTAVEVPCNAEVARRGLAGGGTLGVDYGGRRVGLAISFGGFNPTALQVVRAESSKEKDMKAVVQAVLKEAQGQGASEVVVGLPVSWDASEGPQAQKSRRFAQMLSSSAGRLSIRVYLQDEYGSTKDAQEAMLQRGLGRKARQEKEDSYAAVMILNAYYEEGGSRAERVLPKNGKATGSRGRGRVDREKNQPPACNTPPPRPQQLLNPDFSFPEDFASFVLEDDEPNH